MTKLLINEHPLIVLPTLAKKIGLNEAIILQQIHYWLDPRINKNYKEEKYWVYNTYTKWQEQFAFLSEITIKRTILSLEKQRILISKNFNSNSFNKVKWYTINYQALTAIERSVCSELSNVSQRSDRTDQFDTTIESNRSNECINVIPSIIETETTTETTTKTLSPKSNDDQKKESVTELIKIWEDIIPPYGKPFTLTNIRKQKLLKIFKLYCESDIQKWEQVVRLVSQNKFLMGEVTSFKASLDWAINEENFLGVIEGKYTDKKTFNKISGTNKQVGSIELEKDAFNNPRLQDFIEKLKTNYGEDTYNSWFSKMKFLCVEDGVLKLGAPSQFIRDWIVMHYEKKLSVLAKKCFGVERVRVEISQQ